MSTEQASDKESMRKWRHAFVVLASLELGRAAVWSGPDDFTELKLRVETLAQLLALVPRNELGSLEEVVAYLATACPEKVAPDMTKVRSGIRQLLTEQAESTRGEDRWSARAAAVITRKNISAAVGGTPRSATAPDARQDSDSCFFGMRSWFEELKTNPEWAHIRLLNSEFAIEDIFVELFTVADKDIEAGADGESEKVRGVTGRMTGETHAVIDAATMIARTGSFCIVVGDPGSGKSTLVKWVAQCVADEKIADFEAALVVKLGPYASALAKSPALTLLEYFFDARGSGVQDPSGAANWLRRDAEGGTRHLLLLDGWDEVPVKQRDTVRKRIDHERPFFTTILTSRPSGFPQRLAVGRQTDIYHIAGLSHDGRRSLAERYLRAVGREALLPDLLQQIESNRDLQELASNPFMLALLTWAIDARGVSREMDWTPAELYGRVVDWMVDSIEEIDPDHRAQLVRSLDGLERLSYELLFDERMPQYEFSENKLIRELDSNASSAILRSRFVSQVDSRGNRFSFMHATFEEYFAARHTNLLGEHKLAEVLERAFLSASRGIVLEFIVGLTSRAGQACRVRLERWWQRRDRYTQVAYRVARLLAACPAKLRPPLLMTSIRSDLWNRITGATDLEEKRRGVAHFARLDPVSLCRAIRIEATPDQFILECIAATVPAAVGMTERVADLMDPAMRKRVEAELWGRPRPTEIEANRRTLMDAATDEDRLRQAILFAGASGHVGAVPALVARLRASNLPHSLQEAISTSLGQIGGQAASRALVDLFVGDIPASRLAIGLARRSLQHTDGHKRLDPAGRDAILRRIACTDINQANQIQIQYRMLSVLKGFPIRTGIGLLKHFAFSPKVDESIRRECLQALEPALSDCELDGLLQHIAEENAEVESLLLAMAVRRGRCIPVPWLANRLHSATQLRDKTKLLTVALVMSVQRENPYGDVKTLLEETMRTALLSQSESDTDLARAFHMAMADLPVDYRQPPSWIDLDLCGRPLQEFVSRNSDPSADRVMLAAMLVGRIPTIAAGELLRQSLSGCRDRLDSPLAEMQRNLLIEVARAISSSLAELDPQSLLVFPRDWEPVDEVLHTLSNRRGWLVFDDRILDSEGQRLRPPWQAQEVQLDDAVGDTVQASPPVEKGEAHGKPTQQRQMPRHQEKPSGAPPLEASATRDSDGAAESLDQPDESIEDQRILAWFEGVDMTNYLTALQVFWCLGKVDQAAFELDKPALGYAKLAARLKLLQPTYAEIRLPVSNTYIREDCLEVVDGLFDKEPFFSNAWSNEERGLALREEYLVGKRKCSCWTRKATKAWHYVDRFLSISKRLPKLSAEMQR